MRYALDSPAVLPPPGIPEGMPSPYMPISPKDPTQVFTTTFSPSTGKLFFIF